MAAAPRLLTLLLLGLAAGCAGNRYQLRFEPSPAELPVAGASADAERAGRILVSVLDAERQQPDGESPFEMRLRLRVENTGGDELLIARDTLLLVDADLLPFGPARITDLGGGLGRSDPDAVHLPPGATGSYELAFPLEHGRHPQDRNLDGLNLSCTALVGARSVPLGTSFSRRPVSYATPIHDPFFVAPYGYSFHYGHFKYH